MILRVYFPCSVYKYEDLSARARSRFNLSMKEAMSLKEIAKVWDECGRATMLEYAEGHGGGLEVLSAPSTVVGSLF